MRVRGAREREWCGPEAAALPGSRGPGGPKPAPRVVERTMLVRIPRSSAESARSMVGENMHRARARRMLSTFHLRSTSADGLSGVHRRHDATGDPRRYLTGSSRQNTSAHMTPVPHPAHHGNGIENRPPRRYGLSRTETALPRIAPRSSGSACGTPHPRRMKSNNGIAPTPAALYASGVPTVKTVVVRVMAALNEGMDARPCMPLWINSPSNRKITTLDGAASGANRNARSSAHRSARAVSRTDVTSVLVNGMGGEG